MSSFQNWRSLDDFSRPSKDDMIIKYLFSAKIERCATEWYLLRDIHKLDPKGFRILEMAQTYFMVRLERPSWNGRSYYHDYRVEYHQSDKFKKFLRAFSQGIDGLQILIAEFAAKI